MKYPVLVERKNGHWRAVIPALAGLSAEGATCDEAVVNAQTAAEIWLSNVVVRTINLPPVALQHAEFSTAQDWLEAVRTAPTIDDSDELYQQYLADLEADKQRQREEAEREAELPA
ncbi:MAG TPA: type II toxin-antitoxin system HicB family antitoxin [Blastocatellia bacterium]|nr:type II toxin-antitoxin system HicB family antitoxin [Blastocatellia bacterium]